MRRYGRFCDGTTSEIEGWPAAHIMTTPDGLQWQPMPREWADGPPPSSDAATATGATEVAILQGDPAKEGAPFVMRIRLDLGTRIPPHWHLIDENITVLSGVFC